LDEADEETESRDAGDDGAAYEALEPADTDQPSIIQCTADSQYPDSEMTTDSHLQY